MSSKKRRFNESIEGWKSMLQMLGESEEVEKDSQELSEPIRRRAPGEVEKLKQEWDDDHLRKFELEDEELCEDEDLLESNSIEQVESPYHGEPVLKVVPEAGPITAGDLAMLVHFRFKGLDYIVINIATATRIIGVVNDIFDDGAGHCVMCVAPYKNGSRFSNASIDSILGRDSREVLRVDKFQKIFESMNPELEVRVRCKMGTGAHSTEVGDFLPFSAEMDSKHGMFVRIDYFNPSEAILVPEDQLKLMSEAGAGFNSKLGFERWFSSLSPEEAAGYLGGLMKNDANRDKSSFFHRKERMSDEELEKVKGYDAVIRRREADEARAAKKRFEDFLAFLKANPDTKVDYAEFCRNYSKYRSDDTANDNVSRRRGRPSKYSADAEETISQTPPEPPVVIKTDNGPITVGDLVDVLSPRQAELKRMLMNVMSSSKGILGQVNEIFMEDGDCIMTCAPLTGPRRSDISVYGAEKTPAAKLYDCYETLAGMPADSVIKIRARKSPFGPGILETRDFELDEAKFDPAHGMYMQIEY